jgi:hypothetical protein
MVTLFPFLVFKQALLSELIKKGDVNSTSEECFLLQLQTTEPAYYNGCMLDKVMGKYPDTTHNNTPDYLSVDFPYSFNGI